MQLRHLERFVREVYSRHTRTAGSHGFAQDPSATADVHDAFPSQASDFLDVAQPQWIDIVKRLEFALGVPPAVRQLAELLQFARIDVLHHAILSFQCAAFICSARKSKSTSLRSSTRKRPSTHTWVTCSRPAA